MCICINCKHINCCNTYSFIEIQHNKGQNSTSKTFIPINTLMQINLKFIKSKNYVLDWDLIECLSFTEKPGSWITRIH